MKKSLLTLFFASILLVGCGNQEKKETASSSTATSTSSSVAEKKILKVYTPDYFYSNGTYKISGTVDPSNKLTVKIGDAEPVEVKVTGTGSWEYSDKIPEKETKLTFNDTTADYTETIKSVSDIEKKENEKKAEIAKAKKAEEDKIKAEKAAEEKAAKEEEEANKKAAEKFAARYDTGITFDNLARNPETYEGEKVKFYGKIIQVIKGDEHSQFRFAIDDNYDQILYIEISESQLSNNRLLEDDFITIKGTSYGEYTYSSAIGGEITVPAVVVDEFELHQ